MKNNNQEREDKPKPECCIIMMLVVVVKRHSVYSEGERSEQGEELRVIISWVRDDHHKFNYNWAIIICLCWVELEKTLLCYYQEGNGQNKCVTRPTHPLLLGASGPRLCILFYFLLISHFILPCHHSQVNRLLLG